MHNLNNFSLKISTSSNKLLLFNNRFFRGSIYKYQSENKNFPVQKYRLKAFLLTYNQSNFASDKKAERWANHLIFYKNSNFLVTTRRGIYFAVSHRCAYNFPLRWLISTLQSHITHKESFNSSNNRNVLSSSDLISHPRCALSFETRTFLRFDLNYSDSFVLNFSIFRRTLREFISYLSPPSFFPLPLPRSNSFEIYEDSRHVYT